MKRRFLARWMVMLLVLMHALSFLPPAQVESSHYPVSPPCTWAKLGVTIHKKNNINAPGW